MRFQSSRFDDLLDKWFFFGHDRGHGCYQLNSKKFFLEQSLVIYAHWAQIEFKNFQDSSQRIVNFDIMYQKYGTVYMFLWKNKMFL